MLNILASKSELSQTMQTALHGCWYL